MNAGAPVLCRIAFLATLPWGAPATAATTAEILARSADPGCLEYRPVGGCLWMTCVGTHCTTSTSVKYRHFVPEAVVTGYGAVGAHPWRELGELVKAGSDLDGGTAAKGGGSRATTSYRFRMSEVVGSPGLGWLEALDLAGAVCDAQSVPMAPYYASRTDWAWRDDAVQVPWTVRHLLRQVKEPGIGGAYWGPVYPRGGSVQQPDGYKAAAVVAQRAADIVTRRRQWLHAYRPLAGGDGVGQWGPPPVREGVAGNHKWQMVSPAKGSCGVFGRGEVPAPGARSSSGAYAWNLWRPYECCARRGTLLIGHW